MCILSIALHVLQRPGGRGRMLEFTESLGGVLTGVLRRKMLLRTLRGVLSTPSRAISGLRTFRSPSYVAIFGHFAPIKLQRSHIQTISSPSLRQSEVLCLALCTPPAPCTHLQCPHRPRVTSNLLLLRRSRLLTCLVLGLRRDGFDIILDLSADHRS